MLWRLTMSLGNKSIKIDPVEDLHWFKQKLIFSVHQPMYGTLDFKTLLWMEHQSLNKVLCTCIFKHCLNARFSEYVFYVLEDIHALSWNERKAFLFGATVGFRPLPGWEANALAFTHHHLWMVVSQCSPRLQGIMTSWFSMRREWRLRTIIFHIPNRKRQK